MVIQDIHGDEDNDGITDNLDMCPNTNQNAVILDNESYLGCDWWQIDFDGDGVISSEDSDPFNANIGLVEGGSRLFNESLFKLLSYITQNTGVLNLSTPTRFFERY